MFEIKKKMLISGKSFLKLVTKWIFTASNAKSLHTTTRLK